MHTEYDSESIEFKRKIIQPAEPPPKKNEYITDKGEEVLAREIVIRDLLHKNYGEVKTIWEDILKTINNVDRGASDVVLISIKKKYNALIKKFKERQSCVPKSFHLQMALSEKDRLMIEKDDKSEERIQQVSANKAKIAKVYAEKEHIIQERSTGAIHSVVKDDENVSKIGDKLNKVLKEISSMNTVIRDGSLRVEKAIEKLVAFIAAFVSSTTQPPPQ
ncbi:hypothetical protein F4703DRAFT_1790276 [Phycomyces blakesleeanus]